MSLNKTRKIQGGGIPKIIHQIWIGDNTIPEEWIKTVRDFAYKYHYKYKLWTESTIDSLNWNLIKGMKTAYNTFKLKRSFAGCGDIIRLLALYEFGGIYIDADSVIIKPSRFNQFLRENKARVFFGWQHEHPAGNKFIYNDSMPEIRTAKKLIANGLIGSIKSHPFIKEALEGIPERIKNASESVKTHPMMAWYCAGPLYISRVYFSYKHKSPDIKIYPTKYFYPIKWNNITDPSLHKKIKIPGESMLFQYGYSTNRFWMYFNNCTAKHRS